MPNAATGKLSLEVDPTNPVNWDIGANVYIPLKPEDLDRPWTIPMLEGVVFDEIPYEFVAEKRAASEAIERLESLGTNVLRIVGPDEGLLYFEIPRAPNE